MEKIALRSGKTEAKAFHCECKSSSNFSLQSTTANEEIALAQNHSDIRLFSLNQFASVEPLQDLNLNNVLLKWSVASKGNS